MDDVQHFRVFEDQCAQAGRRLRLADAQVERVQVHVAGVLEGTAVDIAAQVRAHAGGVEQGDLVAHATTLGFLAGGFQLVHVRRFHRRVQVAELQVALDAVFLHAAPDDVVTAPAQVPDEVVDVVAQPLAHLLAHRGIAGQAAGDLPAIAPAGAPADLVGLDDGDLVATLGEFDRSCHPGEAAADDGDVDVHFALQGGVVGFLVEAGGVVGGRALRSSADGFYCSVHCSCPF
ncbi:hypothetical protein D3C76_791360 [compost metagenome]